MPQRELESAVTPSASAPLTRREAREREAAAAKASSVSDVTVSASPAIGAPATEAPRVAAPRFTAQARPAANKPPVRRASLAARVSKKLFSVAALLFAGALLVGMTVPANAFISDPIAFAPEEVASEKLPTQSIAVSAEAATEAMGRDSYEVISYAEQLKSLYSSSSYTYSVTNGSVRWPFPFVSPYTDGFGARGGSHMGVDFTPGGGNPIYAIADGIVVKHEDGDGSYGNHVVIAHSINGQKVESLYAHMVTGSSPLAVGDTIAVGDFIGLVGNTGQSYGAHLHLEIHLDGIPVDPFAWLATNAN